MLPPNTERLARTKLQSELADVYENGPIQDPARFSGRADLLERCHAELAKPGMSFAIHGARGLGKSSFVNVLLVDRKFARRTAERDMQFARLFGPVLERLNEGLVIVQRTNSDAATVNVGVNAPVIQAGSEITTGASNTLEPVIPAQIDFDFVAAALANQASRIDAIVIEEFQRLPALAQRDVVQLMHTLADSGAAVRIVAVGITELDEQLMTDTEYKDYVGRCITPVALPPMTDAELRDIIERRANQGATLVADVADDLVWVASGYPALVQRVMYAACSRWLRENLASLLASAAAGLLSAVVGRLLPGVNENIVVKRIELDKAGVTVGRTELDTAIKAYAIDFESQQLKGAASYDGAVVDPDTKALLEAYARADSDDLAMDAAAALSLPGDLKPPGGLRPYLRAKLLLEGLGSGPDCSAR
jgi:Cdc6-like AAA superfamily ATPase